MNAPMNAPTQAPAWFHNQVVSGLQYLWALGLPGTPAGELAQLTATAWIDTLWCHHVRWQEALDPPRLEAAFKAAARQADRWPTPRQVLQALPDRVPAPALPAPVSRPPAFLKERFPWLGRRQPRGSTE